MFLIKIELFLARIMFIDIQNSISLVVEDLLVDYVIFFCLAEIDIEFSEHFLPKSLFASLSRMLWSMQCKTL